jgi:hypothetical protein
VADSKLDEAAQKLEALEQSKKEALAGMESKLTEAEDYHRHVEEVSSVFIKSLCKSVHKVVLQKSIPAQDVFNQSFCKSQFSHKFVNLFFILVITQDKLTDLCGD